MARLFMRLWAGDRMYLIASRIQRSRKALDIASLTRRVPALISDNDRNLLAVKTVMQFSQPVLQPFQLCLVLIGIQRFIERHL